MKLYRNLLLALLVLSAFSLNAENGSDEPQADGRHERDRDRGRDHDRDHDCGCEPEYCKLEGSYAYELSGSIGPISASLLYDEAGRLSFNGHGQGSGFGVIVIEGVGRVNANYSFTYQEISEGVYEATGSRTTVLGVTQVSFIVATGDCCEHISLLLLPNAAPVTTPPAQAPYNFVQVNGFGGK